MEENKPFLVRFRFEATGESVDVEAYSQLNLLAHAQIAERSLQSRCGGHCECSTCRVVILSGKVSPMGLEERELLLRVGALHPNTRLACQTFPESGEVVVQAPVRIFHDARQKDSSGIK